MKNLWILVLTFTSFNLFSQDFEIKGTVFDDKNGNNLKEQEETGVPNVVVSDQVSSTITDKNGDVICRSSKGSV